jgi:hypothetical protein
VMSRRRRRVFGMVREFYPRLAEVAHDPALTWKIAAVIRVCTSYRSFWSTSSALRTWRLLPPPCHLPPHLPFAAHDPGGRCAAAAAAQGAQH